MIRFLRRTFGKKYVRPSDYTEYQAKVPVEASLPYLAEIATSTASLAIYDLASLKHRIDDECDWWADPKEELLELGARNVLIVGLGSDGYYDVELTEDDQKGSHRFSIRSPTGKIFVGPGESITGGGDEPDGTLGGFFILVEPDDYAVSLSRNEDLLRISFTKAQAFANSAIEPVRI